jgi:hypothetical protein
MHKTYAGGRKWDQGDTGGFMMKDKLTLGFIEGTIAGVVSSLSDLIMVDWIKFGKIRFLDFAGVHLFGFKPETLGEKMFAQVAEIFFTGLLGIIFVYWIDKVKRENILFKGFVFGNTIWFILYSINILYKIEPLKKLSLESSIENYLGSLIFGLVLGFAYSRLSKEIK